MRRLVIAAALAASAGTAWGQTNGQVVPDSRSITAPVPCVPSSPDAGNCITTAPLTIGTHASLIPQCDTGQIITVDPETETLKCIPHPFRPYTPADLARLRHAEWLLLDSDAWTPWQAKMLIEERVRTDMAAGVLVEELERKVPK